MPKKTHTHLGGVDLYSSIFGILILYQRRHSGIPGRVCTTGYLRLACALAIASSNKSLQAKYALPVKK